MRKLDFVYEKLPLWAQNTAVSLYGIYWYWVRFGPGYGQLLQAYKKRGQYDQALWQKWQNKRLMEVLHLAATKVPYYQNTWNESEKSAARAGKLEQLPFLEKDLIRKNPESFLRKDMRPFPRLVHHTSGSTGTPVASIWTVQEYRKAMALREIRSARWAGVSFKLPRATFSGRIVEPDPESTGPFYRFNAVEQQVYFSAFHLSPDTAPLYVEALNKHHIQWLTGYAVSYYLLAQFILEQDLSPPPLKAVITTSEKVTTKMRNVMEKAYGCQVYEEYSTVENVLFASECKRGRLHVSPDAGIVEILRPDGSPCDPDETGEVVATCLMRDYQPFIRFRLGDLAMWDPQSCTCGCAMPVIKEVVGRIEDVVVGPDGRQMVRFHGIFTGQPHVQEGQIVQESLDLIRVKVVPTDEFDLEDIENIIQRLHQRLGTQVRIVIEKVEHIPRTAAGKFKAVISKIEK